ELRIEPLLAVIYSDGQEMITVTALVLTVAESPQFLDHPRWVEWHYKPGADWDTFVQIDVPHLSQRERHAIHAAMTQNAHPAPENVAFRLHNSAEKNAEMFDQYCEHYLRYPTFAPLDTV